MIMEKGYTPVEEYRKTYKHYAFFDNPECPIIGLTPSKDALVKFIKGAAGSFGTEKRILLLHGPVGSSKSTICRLFKRELEKYSATDAGTWYTFKWINLPTGQDGIYVKEEDECPMHEQPLKLLPPEIRKPIVEDLNRILSESVPDSERNELYTLKCDGELDPRCKFFMKEFLIRYDGDLEKILENHIRVIRKTFSEADRVGIATFQPKDEKNQDSTELTGDINFSRISAFGSDSDPRSFNFDGEFCFPAGTPVRMADGREKFIENVSLGDEVITVNGQGKAVIDTMSRLYSGKMVTMSVKGFPFPITMTEDHPVAVIPSRCNWRWQPDDLEWKKAGELTVEDRVVIGFDKQNSVRDIIDLSDAFGEKVEFSVDENDIETIRVPYTQHKNAINRYVPMSPSLARFFGLYLAEGGCYEGKKVVFHLNAKESALANEIIVLAKGLFGVSGTTRLVNERKTGRVVEFHNSNFYDVIKHYVPDNVYFKRVPPMFFAQDEQVKMSLVFGWMDGDGHYKLRKVKNKSAVRMTGVTASAGLARDMTVMALSSGMVATTVKRKAYKHSKESYAVDISGRKALAMKPSLAVTASENGVKLWENDTNRVQYGYARKVKSLDFKAVEDLKVYDITVEEDHSFLASDIVVHNCVGNRGMIEFIEALKLDQAFLYDLLGASQEQSIKPKKFAQVSIDEAILAHTNNPEYERLRSNQYMEALRDRTVKVDVPYTLRWSEELQILEKDYGPNKVKQHIAPHTLEVAALWAVLTRLNDDKDGKIGLVEKAELYDGRMLSGWTEEQVKELKDRYPDEGMTRGVSVRYVQDKLSNCLANNHDYVNMFMVLNELREGLEGSSLLNNKDDVGRYMTCIDLVVKKLTEILKAEVQKALVGDEDAIIRLCGNYIDNIMAYINKSKIKDQITGQDRKPDERLMRAIESKIDIPEPGADDFRRQIAAFIGELAVKGKQFRWESNPKLKKALEAKLFEDVKDTIKLSALNVSGSTVVDKDIQEKIDAIKTRLKKLGYNERSATDVLDFVGSIFARGDLAEE
jgi:predicted Ser/Thr protein kinase